MKFEFQEKIDEKQSKWQQIGHEVENIKDKLGKDIDENIKFSVISLKANNFGTTGSCEGHIDSAYPWPWIDVESPLSENLLSNQRYRELGAKSRASRKGGDAMLKEDNQELESLIKKQKQENGKEYQRLQGLLAEFYALQSKQNNDNLANSSKLGIIKGPWNQSRLQPLEVPDLRPQEAQGLWSDEEKEQKLILYRQEINRFSEFLKNKFFDKK